MLKHLIKYDLKYIYKQLAVFYAIVIFFAILARLTNFASDSFILKFIHEFAQGACLGFSFGTFINATIRTWVRFRSNIYGDESYLTHTLPISRHALWASKFLTSLIVTAISIIVFLIAFLIMFFSEEFIRGWLLDDPSMVCFYLIAIAAIFLQIVFIIQCGFMGTLIGFRHNNNRVAHSAVYGLAIYIIGGLSILMLSISIWSIFDPGVNRMVFSGIIENANNLNKLLGGIAIIYTGIITLTYFINDKLLSHGVDVD